MSKISNDAAHAFNGGYDFKRSNTEVIKYDTEIRMYLHNNLIAKKIYGDGTYLSSCGWETATTKSRLNAILDLYQDKDQIYQKAFIWYWKNDEEFKDGWNKI